MTDKETPVAAILFFKMRIKNIPSQDFVMRNIPVNLRSLPIIPFALEGHQKSLLKVEKNVHGGHVVFQNEAKNIPRQDFMVMNISCKFKKACYNIIFVRAVTVKSLHTAAAA